jgi:hypothetical protein
MKDQQLKQILDEIGQAAFPNDSEPWSPIQARLAPQPSKTFSARPRLALGAALALLAVLGVFLFSPGGKAMAENLRHLFTPITVEQMPTIFPTLSSAELAGPTHAPTFAAVLAPVQEEATPVPPNPMPTGLSACEADPYGYTCRVAQAERKAGFDAKEFPADPRGFRFETAIYSEPRGEIWFEYHVIGGGGFLYLSQGLGSEFPPFSGGVLESAIEPVQVGEHPGEYAAGMFAQGGIYTQTTWVPSDVVARLRWTDGERWYHLEKMGGTVPSEYLTREVLIQMAEELVYQPAPTLDPRPEYMRTLAEAAQLVDFPIAAPTILPDKFVFDYASYDGELSQLRLHYGPPGGQGIAQVLIIETPLDKVSLAPGDNGAELKGEAVDINGSPGVYFSDSPHNHSLTWQVGEIQVTMWVYSSEIWFSATFTQEQILEIARSIR